MKLFIKARADYVDSQGRRYHWNGSRYVYVKKGRSKAPTLDAMFSGTNHIHLNQVAHKLKDAKDRMNAAVSQDEKNRLQLRVTELEEEYEKVRKLTEGGVLK